MLHAASASGLACSGGTKATGLVETCYNSSWMYFSIEGCRPSISSSTAINNVIANSTSSSRNNEKSGAEPRRAGVIAGTIVASIAGTALLITGVSILMRRHPKVKPAVSHELPSDHALVETVSVEKQVAKELEGDHAAVEMGRNSRFETQTESEVEKPEVEDEDVDDQCPIIRIHLIV